MLIITCGEWGKSDLCRFMMVQGRGGKGAECWCTLRPRMRSIEPSEMPCTEHKQPLIRLEGSNPKSNSWTISKVLWPSVGVSSISMHGPKNRTAYYGDGSGAAQKVWTNHKVQGFLFGNLVKGGVWDSIFLILCKRGLSALVQHRFHGPRLPSFFSLSFGDLRCWVAKLGSWKSMEVSTKKDLQKSLFY